MGLRLIESVEFPIYNDGRVFNWDDHGYYMIFGNYTIIHRSGDVWEIFYKNVDGCERLSWGSKEFCVKLVEHEIRQSELKQLRL